MAQTGANAVALTPTWYMADKKASVIAPTDATPTDDSLRLIIRRAKALGLRPMSSPTSMRLEGALGHSSTRTTRRRGFRAIY